MELQKFMGSKSLTAETDELSFLNDLVEQTVQPVAVVDFDGHFVRFNRYVYANETAERSFRTKLDDLLGRTDDEISPADTADLYKENDRIVISSRESLETTETLRQDDRLHHFLVNKFPMLDKNGYPVMAGGIAIDITERKRAEENLKESLVQLCKKNRYETIISAVTRSVHRSVTLQAVLENAVKAMSENLDRTDIVEIYMIEGEWAVLKAHIGYENTYIKRPGKRKSHDSHTCNLG